MIVSLVKLCGWFGVPRRTSYYKPTKGEPKVQEQLVKPTKARIEENPSFGYRTVAHLLDMNTVQRVFQIMGWQVCNRPVGFRPRIQFDSNGPQRAMGHRHVPSLVRTRQLGHASPGDRLLHPRTSGMASQPQCEIQDGRISSG